MFKKTLIFLLIFGFAVSASAARASKAHKHHRGAAKMAQVTAKININKADADALAAIKGLGAKKAEAIVAYREANGNFKSIDDLTNVKGIGTKRLAKIKSNLTV
ncbi:MAG: helix-hairpin-helix domain-containing protein [Gammaproteobacteria bacterium]|jgi:competence protein ComEA